MSMVNQNYSINHSHASLNDYFYSKEVLLYATKLKSFLKDPHEIHLFPEATIKKNKVPNGILIESPKAETFFMASVLRDPGCGFLSFSCDLDAHKLKEVKEAVNYFFHNLEESQQNSTKSFRRSLKEGISFLPEAKRYFNDSCFSSTDLFSSFDHSRMESLALDLTQITNTLEARIVENEVPSNNNAQLIGFIHTGSEFFAQELHRRWFYPAADFTYKSGLASVKLVNEGYYGFFASTELGEEYLSWIRSAMNFCLYKRWWLFEQLRHFILAEVGEVFVPLSDRCHAGIFEETNRNTFMQSRGIQLIQNHNLPFIIAGHRESEAYLFVIPPSEQALSFVGHGTSYMVDNSFNYSELLGQHFVNQYNGFINDITANTPLDRENSLALNFNAIKQKEWLQQFDVRITPLQPWLNLHGRYLRNG